MGDDRSQIPLRGVWYRHVRGGGDPLGLPPAGARGRWQRGGVIGAVYLAEDSETTWAEFYRAAAEQHLPPERLLPRDLWSYRVALERVVDMTDPAALAAAGLAPSTPTSAERPAYQALGEQLATAGAQGVLYHSAARPVGRCVCVFETALEGLTPLDRVRVHAPPAPPPGTRS